MRRQVGRLCPRPDAGRTQQAGRRPVRTLARGGRAAVRTSERQPRAVLMGAQLHCGDALTVLKTLPDECVQCVVTSPPYWGLRDYRVTGQLGMEATPEQYVATMVTVFVEVRRVLTGDGTLWLNLGDSYAGSCGARARPHGNDVKSTLQVCSRLSARQIAEHPQETGTGSLKN